MKTTLLVGLGAVCLSGLWGCDSQAGPAYQGEALLTIGGSVVVENPQAPGSLSPALAFRGDYEGRDSLYIQDVGVRGEFPANFRLDVFELPPEAAFQPVSQEPNAPRLARGYITAVPSDHERVVGYENVSYTGWCDGTDTLTCYEDKHTCPPGFSPGLDSPPDEVCYNEHSLCNAEYTSCTVQSTFGDEAYATSMWEHLGGLSQNYLVIYAENEVPVGTSFTKLNNGGRALSAGYHLFKVLDPDDAELKASASCHEEVANEVWGPLYGPDLKELDQETQQRAHEEVLDKMIERGCPLIAAGGFYELVDPAAARDLAVRIAPGIEPSDPFRN